MTTRIYSILEMTTKLNFSESKIKYIIKNMHIEPFAIGKNNVHYFTEEQITLIKDNKYTDYEHGFIYRSSKMN